MENLFPEVQRGKCPTTFPSLTPHATLQPVSHRHPLIIQLPSPHGPAAFGGSSVLGARMIFRARLVWASHVTEKKTEHQKDAGDRVGPL